MFRPGVRQIFSLWLLCTFHSAVAYEAIVSVLYVGLLYLQTVKNWVLLSAFLSHVVSDAVLYQDRKSVV